LLAEEAAARSWQPHPWLRMLVAQGDAERRMAQDHLFSGKDYAELIRARLEGAEQRYEETVTVARAIELARRVEADLPFLGAWYVRRQARLRERIDPRVLESIANDAVALNSALDAKPDLGNTQGLAALATKTETLERSFGGLLKPFRAECGYRPETLSWRAVD